MRTKNNAKTRNFTKTVDTGTHYVYYFGVRIMRTIKEGKSMPEYNLRGCIISKYHSMVQFAKSVNWSTRKTYDIVNGKQDMTAKDIETICDALEIEIPAQFKRLFFSS